MKTCFSERKLIKEFGIPLSKRTPSFQLTPLPPISEQFFHDSYLCPNFKNKSLILGMGGGGNYALNISFLKILPQVEEKLDGSF